jgi:hypothetical protein
MEMGKYSHILSYLLSVYHTCGCQTFSDLMTVLCVNQIICLDDALLFFVCLFVFFFVIPKHLKYTGRYSLTPCFVCQGGDVISALSAGGVSAAHEV